MNGISRIASRACAVAVALASVLLAQSPDRDAGFRADLSYLASELPARHANAFHQISRAEFNTAVEALDREIPLLGDTEIMVRMARIVASIGDSHTNLSLPQGRAPFRRFPFTFYGFIDGWRVNAVVPELSHLLGCRIVQVGETPIAEVYTRVASVISHDNEAWVQRQFPNYARWSDVLKTLGIISSLNSARWTFETLAGEQFSVEVPTFEQSASLSPVTLPDDRGFTPLYRQNTALNYWYTYLDSSRTLYFAYNLCRESAERPMAGFTQELFRVFDTMPVDRLIIDLRNNPGGASNVINPFLSALQARESRFAGGTKKLVIIGRATASSGMLAAVSLKQQPYTVLIGEPTGGKPNSYGEVQTLTLPYSGATVGYSTRFIVLPITTESVLPDRSISFYSRDYFARHDPFLAAALADAPPALSPPSVSPLVSSATFRQGPVAPASLASLFLPLPGVSTEVSSYPFALKLAGVEVQIGGHAAPLLAVTPGQINLQVPLGLPAGAASVRVARDGVEVMTAAAQIASSSPGLFLADLLRGDQPGAVLNHDSRLNTLQSRARRGEVIQIFATGAGLAESRAAPRVYVAAEAAVVTYTGDSPEFPGLWQVNVRLPDSPQVTGQVPVFVIAADGAISNGVTVWVEP